MNNIEELIAAGEAALVERSHKSSKNILEEENSLTSLGSFKSNFMKDSGSDILAKPDLYSKHAFKKPENAFEDLVNPFNNVSLNNDQGMMINCMEYGREKEQLNLLNIKDNGATQPIKKSRLLSNLLKNQLVNSSYEKSLLEEVNLCEENCLTNEGSLKSIAEDMHSILAKLSDQQRKFDNQENELKLSHERASNILSLITELLNKTGFKHLAPNVSQNGVNIYRLLEESHLGLMLLSGELPDHILQSCNHQLDIVLSREEKLKTQISSIQEQYTNILKTKEEKIAQLEINIEKLHKDLDDFKYHLSVSEEQKFNSEESFKKQLGLYEDEITDVRHHMVQVEQDAKQQVKKAKETFALKQDATESLSLEIDALKSQIQLKDTQIENIQDESNGLIKSLNTKISKLESELSTLKVKLAGTNEEKKAFADKVKKLQSVIEENIHEKDAAAEKFLKVREEAAEANLSHAEDMQEIQSKLDSVNATLCEKNSEVRSRDVKIMHLETELKLEGQRSLVFKGETDLLEKQVKRLQEKIGKLLEGRPREEHFLMSGINASIDPKDMASRELKKSQERERQLQILLEEKDSEMKGLQESLNSQLLHKNSELQKLGHSVESLEREMENITSSLNVSRNIADVSDHVNEALESRSHALEKLQDSSRKLHSECSQIVQNSSRHEEQEKRIEDLASELSSSKKIAKEAREEARASRLEAANERQRCAFLQIDLDSAKEALRQVRLEQNLWEGLSCFKQRSIGSRTSESFSLDLASDHSGPAAESSKGCSLDQSDSPQERLS